MDETSREQIQSKSIEVLEQLAFLLAEVPDDPSIDPVEDTLLQSVIHFSGSKHGTFSIASPASIAIDAAANLLAIDPGDDDAKSAAAESLNEILNVLSGHWATVLFGEDSNVDLSASQSKTISKEEWKKLQHQDHVIVLSIDDSPILLGIAIGG